MKNNQKASAKKVLSIVIVIFVIIFGYLILMNKPATIPQDTITAAQSTTPTPVTSTQPTASTVVTPVVPPANARITIVSPNGGEIMSQKGSFTVTWNYAGLNDNDSLTIGFRTPSESVCWAGKTTASRGNYSFIPSKVMCEGSAANLMSGGQYKAQIVVDKYTNGVGVSDTSDKYFTVSAQ